MEVGDRVKIINTNSFWDNKEGVLESIDEESSTCTIFVDFNVEEDKRVRQDFNLSNVEPLESTKKEEGPVQESLRDINSGETGKLIRIYRNGYGLFQTDDGKVMKVCILDLEKIKD